MELTPETFSSQKGGILMNYGMEGVPRHPLLHSSSLNSLINLDRPYHTPLRMEHMAYFRADFVAELKKKVEVEVNRLLDTMQAQGPVVDMVEMFSAELPLFTLCEILGVPAADRPKLVHWMHFLETSQYQAQQEGLGNVSPEQIMTFLTEIQAMFEYGRYLLEERRKNPQPDLLSAIANVKIDGQPLSPRSGEGLPPARLRPTEAGTAQAAPGGTSTRRAIAIAGPRAIATGAAAIRWIPAARAATKNSRSKANRCSRSRGSTSARAWRRNSLQPVWVSLMPRANREPTRAMKP